jgi:peptidoglycan/LPS O-acetylase OafA/YrhL
VSTSQAPSAPAVDRADGALDAPASRRLPEIQGLRALAILLVLIYHAGLPLRGGFVGVDVFFVISGFVITRLLMGRQLATGRIGFATFYRRRVRRLLPALAAAVSFAVIGSMLLESPIEIQGRTAATGIGASMWLGNAAQYIVSAGYFDPSSKNAVLLHTWSLAVEEQFYVVFPVLIGLGFWLATRRRRATAGRYPWRTVGAIIAVIVVVSLAINFWLCYGSPEGIPRPKLFAFFSPFSRSWEFGAGALVALGAARMARWSRTIHRSMAGLGAVLVLGSTVLLQDSVVYPGLAALLPVVGTALLIAGVISSPTRIGDALSTPGAVRVGDLSYSLYLWHWPFIALAVTALGDSWWVRPAAAVLSVPVAILSYERLEERFRHRSGRRGVGKLLVSSVGIPVTLSIVLLMGSSVAWGNDTIRDWKSQVAPKSRVGDLCGASPIKQKGVVFCRYKGDPAKPQVVLLGDSNAAQYADGLIDAGRELNRTVVVATVPLCAMNLVETYDRSGTSQRCLSRAQEVLSWLDDEPASLVFVAAANQVVDRDGFSIRDGKTGEKASSVPAKARIWAAGLQRTFKEIQDQGHRVVQIQTIPHFWHDGEAWQAGDCSFPQLLFRRSTCGPSMPLAAANAAHRAGLEAEKQAAQAAGVGSLDVTDQVCPDGTCSVRRGNFWVYRDGLHLSLGMSRKLRDTFVEAIKAERGALS